jgi:hypothetical protein
MLRAGGFRTTQVIMPVLAGRVTAHFVLASSVAFAAVMLLAAVSLRSRSDQQHSVTFRELAAAGIL